MQIIEEAYNKAVEVLEACAQPRGFYASGLPGGYNAVWSRDSMTAALGGALIGDKFKKTIAAGLKTLARHQAEMGQIPNCVGSYNIDRQSDVTFNSVDAPLWFIIGHYIYAYSFNDASLFKNQKHKIARAYWWLRAQDPDNIGLIAQQPTGDWQDAFPHKYGYTIHIHALYYAVLKILGEKSKAKEVKKIINGEKRKYSSLYSPKLGYYLPWGWKNHDSIREREEWFDSAGNLLAIITGLATPKISKKILGFIKKQKINKPFPVKTIWPPIKPSDKEWHDYFALCDAREPYQYLNAGVWPFIGGLYVATLVKVGDIKKAQTELKSLAKANLRIIKKPQSPPYIITKEKTKLNAKELKKIRQKEFNEWLDGRTGEPKGEPYQAWSAGAYIYAYECVRQKKVLFF